MHTHTSARGHGNAPTALDFSLSSFLLLLLPFISPLRFLSSAAFFYLFSDLSSSPAVPKTVYDGVPTHTRARTHARVCAERRDGESRSRVGAGLSPMARKDKDSSPRARSRAALMRGRARTRGPTTARTNLRSYQDNPGDITPPQERRGGRGFQCPLPRPELRAEDAPALRPARLTLVITGQ